MMPQRSRWRDARDRHRQMQERSMKEEKTKAAVKRRDFLKQAGLVVGTAGAAAAVTRPTEALASEAETKTGGYRETEHIKTYYELARF
jgi:hypothetical protein